MRFSGTTPKRKWDQQRFGPDIRMPDLSKEIALVRVAWKNACAVRYVDR
jgi:hypothetical protein